MANIANGDVSTYIQALISENIEDLKSSANNDKPSGESSGIEENQEAESNPSNRTG